MVDMFFPHFITYILGVVALVLIARNFNLVYKKVRLSGHIKFLIVSGLIIQVLTLLSGAHNHYQTWFVDQFTGGELRDLIWIFHHYTTILFHIIVSCALGAHLEFRRWRKRSEDN